MKFRTTVLRSGKTTTGIEVPAEVVSALGTSKKPAVRVTINGHTYRNSIAVMGGRYMVGISADNRAATGVAGGDEIDVEIVLDTEPREVVVPDDFAAALDAEPAARAFFDGLSYSRRRWFVLGIGEAKKPETRRRRIEQAVERLRDGRGQR
ncbi:MAG TPA: YdeI/OmpD-associated family protein [Kribbella sp.]|nr:YdeI/OmpD-associated family protein [Kribbella sp.]